jgi:hypothetical protein
MSSSGLSDRCECDDRALGYRAAGLKVYDDREPS